MLVPPPRGTNLVDLLCHRAATTPERMVYRFLVEGEVDGPQDVIDFGRLDQRARALAVLLEEGGLRGRCALLMHPVGLEYVIAFVGCLYAGVVPVPAYPPDPARLLRMVPRLQAIVRDCAASALLTTAAMRTLAATRYTSFPGLSTLRWIATDEVDPSLASQWRRRELNEDDVAFLQYTSGSTGDPKGVMVTHRNLAINIAAMSQRLHFSDSTVMVCWLPPYHDLGLISGLLPSIYTGMMSVLMSPLSFLQKPLRWLHAISRFRGYVSGGPNFAYDLCTRKATEIDTAALDLSHWRIAFNGAEPLRADTLERFARTFAPCGFQRRALHPTYGLAEATVLTSIGRQSEYPVLLRVDEAALSQRRVVLAPDGKDLVAIGMPIEEVRIVDPETRRSLRPNQLGELWLRGGSVAAGYWGKPAETAETFGAHLADGGDGPFLRTGDLGFLHEGQLYVTGRMKDVIIVRGRNLWPQDVEHTAATAHAAVRPGAVAAFPVEHEQEESLSVLAGVADGEHDLPAVAAAIRSGITAEHGVEPVDVVLALARAIPKTSSGKLQRRASRQGLADGTIPVLYHDRRATVPAVGRPSLSLFFFSSDAEAGNDLYGLFFDSIRAADELGFEAVWIPERHFHPFGGLFPNPSVLAAAAAACTERLRIRAGSVVLPLHDPIRVAEEWAVVDQLSKGRVDLAFAVGWNPNDFVLRPDGYAQRQDRTFAGIETIRRLWQGEAIKRVNGTGTEVPMRIYPRPQQDQIALWLTCSGGPQRFIDAGQRGFNVLTALLFQTPEELHEKLTLYRKAREEAGLDPLAGRVTLMLHTFVGDTPEQVERAVRRPLLDYLESSVDLWRQESRPLASLTAQERAAVLDYAAERYCRNSALIGTPERCAAMLARLAAAGVNEVACLIDFGVEREVVMGSVRRLAALRGTSQATCSGVQLRPATPAPPGRRNEEMEALIRAELTGILGALPPARDGDLQFGVLGIDSVRAVALSERLAAQLGRPLPATLLFSHLSVASLAAHLVSIECGEAQDAARHVDLERDGTLPAEIRAGGKPVAFTARPRSVLLTGATGFLGAFLLHELLLTTTARVFCLIRAASVEQAHERLRASLAEFDLWQDLFRERIVPVLGDLALPALGLAAAELDALAQDVDLIIHNGAVVHFAYRYELCRAANIGGTLEILRLACQGQRLIPVHYISTTAVFSHFYAGQVVGPADVPEDSSRLDMGYAQSKWAAERLARKARERGLPITIYRPGLVTGAARTGACHLTNFVWNLIRVSVEIGAFPDYERQLDMTPVDWAAAAIVRCCGLPGSLGQTFHLVNQRPISIPELGRWFASRGYGIKQISFESWQLRLFERVTTTPALSALLPVLGLAAADFYEHRHVRFESPDADAPFRALEMPCPPIDDDLLDRYLGYFVKRGFLPSLAAQRSAPSQERDFALHPDRIYRMMEDITGLSISPRGFWREPMEVLLADMNRYTDYHPEGLRRATSRMVNALIRHARTEDLVRRHPEILQIPIRQPIFIVAPPRTGTTLLHNLLALDPQNRSFALWEMLAPVTPRGCGTSWQPHMERVAGEYLDELYTLSPSLRSIHPMSPQLPDECQWLLANSFTSPVYTLISYVPSYMRWLLEADMTPAYLAYRRALQVLLWRSPGSQLVLKCPNHMWHLDTLLAVFPDARIIQLRRDMKQVVPSLCSLARALQSVEGTPLDDATLGPLYLDWLDKGLVRMLKSGGVSKQVRFLDVSYPDLVADPGATVERIYRELALSQRGVPIDRVQAYLSRGERGDHRLHRYRLEDFGLTEQLVTERFQHYERDSARCGRPMIVEQNAGA